MQHGVMTKPSAVEKTSCGSTASDGGGCRCAAETAAAPLLLDVAGVAGALACSERHVRRLADAGRMPRPVKLGTLIRWNRVEIERWIAAGCPEARRGVAG
jgi:excisionase family DNA binding protein